MDIYTFTEEYFYSSNFGNNAKGINANNPNNKPAILHPTTFLFLLLAKIPQHTAQNNHNNNSLIPTPFYILYLYYTILYI